MHKTPRPVTYCIDYGGRNGYLHQQDRMMKGVSAAPPHIMHIGHDVPFPNTFGPIVLTDDGRSHLLSPSEVRERTTEVRDFVRRIREAGCKTIIPYICNQTLVGHPEDRLGVWQFYDHWDEYSEFGIPERPEADPIDWLARERTGTPHFNYEMRHEAFTPYGMFRWAPCCNNPHYGVWLELVVSQIARAGFDGVFVDNCILNCHCDYCQRGFRRYIAERYSPEEMERAFGAKDASELSLGHVGSRLEWVKEAPTFKEFLREHFTDEQLVRWLGTADLETARLAEGGNGWLWGRAHDYRRWMESRHSPDGLEELIGVRSLADWGLQSPEQRLLWAETKRFWAQSVCDNLRYIKDIGLKERDDFIVTPNWGNMEEADATEFREEIGHTVSIWAPGMDFMMFEEGNMPGAIAPGLYVDHILQHKFAQSLGVLPAVLPYGHMHDGTVGLANAQSAAFGGLAFIQPGTAFTGTRAEWTAFFEQHGDLLEGAEPVADVALALLFDEVLLENTQHLQWTYQISRYLADQHVLFDVVTEKQLNADALSRYKALVLPSARYLSDAQIEAVKGFADKGGALVLIGRSATHDERAEPRPQWGFADLLDKTQVVAPGLSASEHGRVIAASRPDALIGAGRVTREAGLQFATYSQGSINVPFGSAGLVYELDRMIGVDRYLDPLELVPRLEGAAGRKLRLADPHAAMGVRFNLCRKRSDNENLLLLHVVNYNAPLTPHPRGKTVEVMENLDIRLPMNPDQRVLKVKALQPGAEEEELRWNADDDVLAITLPRLDVYRLIVIELAPTRAD